MNRNIDEGQWKEIRGESKAWCGKLAEDDLAGTARRADVIAGLIQEEYDLARRGAVKKADPRMSDFEFKLNKENALTVQ